MNLMATLDDVLSPAGLVLRRAQPGASGQVTMELLDRGGALCAGLWDTDASVSRRIASELVERAAVPAAEPGTGGLAPTLRDPVELLGGGHLVVQRGGVDRHLVGLPELVRRPGARLVAHRPERRAVVQVDPERYATVVRPGRTGTVVVPLRQLPGADVRVPRVLEVDEDRGRVVLSAVTGPTLLQCLSDPGADDRAVAREVGRLGLALRTFHDQPSTVARVVHDRASEAAVVRRWLEAATRFGLLADGAWRPLLDRVCAAIPERPAELAVLHRDLHDRHVVIGSDEPVGLLDLDLVAYGDPALDLATVLVNLDLRALEGTCTPERAALCAAALLEGYAPGSELSGRLAAHAGLVRLRVVGVESFRPAPAGLVDRMLSEMQAGPKSWLWQSWVEGR